MAIKIKVNEQPEVGKVYKMNGDYVFAVKQTDPFTGKPTGKYDFLIALDGEDGVRVEECIVEQGKGSLETVSLTRMPSWVQIAMCYSGAADVVAPELNHELWAEVNKVHDYCTDLASKRLEQAREYFTAVCKWYYRVIAGKDALENVFAYPTAMIFDCSIEKKQKDVTNRIAKTIQALAMFECDKLPESDVTNQFKKLVGVLLYFCSEIDYDYCGYEDVLSAMKFATMLEEEIGCANPFDANKEKELKVINVF